MREWRARVGAERASAYPEHFRGAVLPKLRALDGFVTATLLSRRVDEHVEFVVLTRWTSLESIRGFAGQDLSKAVVEPAARATLSSFDLTVQHYDVLAEVLNRPGFSGDDCV